MIKAFETSGNRKKRKIIFYSQNLIEGKRWTTTWKHLFSLIWFETLSAIFEIIVLMERESVHSTTGKNYSMKGENIIWRKKKVIASFGTAIRLKTYFISENTNESINQYVCPSVNQSINLSVYIYFWIGESPTI